MSLFVLDEGDTSRQREAVLAVTKPYLTVICFLPWVNFPQQFPFSWTQDALSFSNHLLPYPLPLINKSNPTQDWSLKAILFDKWLFHGLGCSWLSGFAVKTKLVFLTVIYLLIYFTCRHHGNGNQSIHSNKAQ